MTNVTPGSATKSQVRTGVTWSRTNTHGLLGPRVVSVRASTWQRQMIFCGRNSTRSWTPGTPPWITSLRRTESFRNVSLGLDQSMPSSIIKTPGLRQESRDWSNNLNSVISLEFTHWWTRTWNKLNKKKTNLQQPHPIIKSWMIDLCKLLKSKKSQERATGERRQKLKTAKTMRWNF